MLDFDDFPMIEFTANERCDACGARALSAAQREDMTELLLCFHHRKAHKDRLLDEGWHIVDGTEALEMLADNEKVMY